MNADEFSLLMTFLYPLILLLVTYAIGRGIERRHLKKLRQREERHRTFPAVTFAELPAGWQPTASTMVHGNVVISLDYFKRFVAGLRALVGGRIKSYEPLLDRARREAVMRMVEDAKRRGYHAVINVRLETARLANARGNGQGTAGIEMLAFGTALKLADQPS